jgi:hypothetical protein
MCQNLAGGIKALSDQHSCNTMSGTIEGVRYPYHSTGQHCDTTAQRDTIAGAIKKFLSNVWSITRSMEPFAYVSTMAAPRTDG